MIKDYVVGIGLDAVKERLKNEHEVRQLKDRLGEFVERQRKLNFNCTREEELDFGGLTDYIRSDLIEDVLPSPQSIRHIPSLSATATWPTSP